MNWESGKNNINKQSIIDSLSQLVHNKLFCISLF